MDDATFNEICQWLEVIGTCEENYHFFTEGDDLNVSPPQPWDGVVRWMAGEKRKKNLEKLTNIIDRTFSLIRGHLDKEHTLTQKTSTNSQFHIEKMRNVQNIDTLIASLGKAKEGLTKWMKTYRSDNNMLAKIQFLIQRIDNELVILDNSLKLFKGEPPRSKPIPVPQKLTVSGS